MECKVCGGSGVGNGRSITMNFCKYCEKGKIRVVIDDDGRRYGIPDDPQLVKAFEAGMKLDKLCSYTYLGSLQEIEEAREESKRNELEQERKRALQEKLRKEREPFEAQERQLREEKEWEEQKKYAISVKNGEMKQRMHAMSICFVSLLCASPAIGFIVFIGTFFFDVSSDSHFTIPVYVTIGVVVIGTMLGYFLEDL